MENYFKPALLFVLAIPMLWTTQLSAQHSMELIGTYETEGTFFTVASKAVLWQDEVIVVDQNTPVLHRFSSEGELLQTGARTGRGPGEVSDLSNFALNSSTGELLVLDRGNQLVHSYALSDFTHKSSMGFDIHISFLSGIFASGDDVYITGNHEGREELVHKFSSTTKEHQKSFGTFIDWDETGIHTINPMIRTQLLTGSVFKCGSNLIFNIDAPYIIRKVNADYEPVWEITDSVFQEPWIEHIDITPETYNVGMYPRIGTMRPLDDETFIVHYVIMEGGRENWEYWLDIRSVGDGSLISRFMLDEQKLLQDAQKDSNGDVNLLFRMESDYTFSKFRLGL